jgi:hypothetical protein
MDAVMTRNRERGDFTRKGCPRCGGDAGYRVEVWTRTFQAACNRCGEWFPKNDFAAFYRSGLDAGGWFDPARADRGLLFNREHAGAQDPLRGYGVDDAFGYADADGFRYRFVALWNDAFWNELVTGIGRLADAFVLTGQGGYAGRCGILLARIAEVYREMDWAPYARLGWYHSDGDSGRGKVFGRISECGLVQSLAIAADKIAGAIAPDSEAGAFLRDKVFALGPAGPAGFNAALHRHIASGILEVGLAGVRDEQIRGNHGHHETAAAWCAVALGSNADTRRWLDWLFSPDGKLIPEILTERMDRDGLGAEGAPGYGWGWGAAFARLAELLEGYGGYRNWSLYRDFPLFRRSFTAPLRGALLNAYTPNVGDFGACMVLNRYSHNAALLFDGFRRTGDAEIAQALLRPDGLNPTQDASGVCRDVFDPDPGSWDRRVAAAALKAPSLPDRGRLNPGFGLVSLEHGDPKSGTALWMNFGMNRGHGHADRLNLGLLSGGVDLLPDLGYPDFATRYYPKRAEWTSNTISHNTVVVDRARQRSGGTGRLRCLKLLPGIRVAEVAADGYPQTQEYRRLVALVETPDRRVYGVDLFRVRGGEEHLLSYHGPETVQPAPAGIRFGQSSAGAEYLPSECVGYLEQFRSAPAPDTPWTYTWETARQWLPAGSATPSGLRLHMLSRGLDRVVRARNPSPSIRSRVTALDYLFLHAQGPGPTVFATLLEPFSGSFPLRGAKRIGLKSDPSGAGLAIEVELTDGHSDLLLASGRAGEPIETAGGWRTDAMLAHVRLEQGVPIAATVVGGSVLSGPGVRLRTPMELSGRVTEVTGTPGVDLGFRTDLQLPGKRRLDGETVLFDSPSGRDAAYRVAGAETSDTGSQVSIGADTFAYGYLDPRDYSRGMRYLVQEGTPFRILNHAQGERTDRGWRWTSLSPALG